MTTSFTTQLGMVVLTTIGASIANATVVTTASFEGYIDVDTTVLSAPVASALFSGFPASGDIQTDQIDLINNAALAAELSGDLSSNMVDFDQDVSGLGAHFSGAVSTFNQTITNDTGMPTGYEYAFRILPGGLIVSGLNTTGTIGGIVAYDVMINGQLANAGTLSVFSVGGAVQEIVNGGAASLNGLTRISEPAAGTGSLERIEYSWDNTEIGGSLGILQPDEIAMLSYRVITVSAGSGQFCEPDLICPGTSIGFGDPGGGLGVPFRSFVGPAPLPASPILANVSPPAAPPVTVPMEFDVELPALVQPPQTTPVPVPGSGALICAALVGAWLRRRKVVGS